jgi:mono/diheme cytochrome c family protein
MQRSKSIAWKIGPLGLTLIFAFALVWLSLPRAAAQSSGDQVIYLDQGWSQADREMYYNESQGSRVVSYDIYENLELAGSEDLFRSDANSAHYGLILQSANPRTNPDAFPVGVARTTVADGRWKGDYVGLTCAACHSAQLNYRGKQIRIDGGSANTFDFMGYMYALDDAMQATLADQAKFARLAGRIGATNSDAVSALRARFESDAANIHQYRTRTLVTQAPYGPGRIDAFSLIFDRVSATETGIGENWSPPVEPAKPPFVWNAPQGSWTQWGAGFQDPILRNMGETFGVYLPMDLHSKTPAEGLFDSPAVPLNLIKIEALISRLAPPQWPESVLGKIDRAKAAEGKVLFMANCASCHNAYPYTWTPANGYGKRFIQVGMVPWSYVGTEPQTTYLRPYAVTGKFSDYMPGPYKGKALVPLGVFQSTLSGLVRDTALAKLTLTPAQVVEMHGYREMPLPPAPVAVYKAAPRDGVWATPPFLHNGSVPNIYEMLIPAKQRTKRFYVGREFDPVKLGLDTTATSGGYIRDTTLPGNSNAGHSFENGPRGHGVIGPLLTEEQRWAIIEYLKSIPDVAGRVTPFGGPPDAKTGSGPWIR